MKDKASEYNSQDPLIQIPTLDLRWKENTKYLSFMVGAKTLWENFVGGDF